MNYRDRENYFPKDFLQTNYEYQDLILLNIIGYLGDKNQYTYYNIFVGILVTKILALTDF